MGRHTKALAGDDDTVEDGPQSDEPEQEQARNFGKMLAKVPLLPVMALVVAIGAVSYAYGTSQISLNFSGGPPQGKPPADLQEGTVSGRNSNGQPSQNVSRTRGPVVAFRVAKRTAGGFVGTVTITNRGTASIQGWTLGWMIPNVRVTEVSNAIVVRNGRAVWVRNTAETPSLPPGASLRVTYTAQGLPARVTTCRFNNAVCVRV
jgi:cellulose binding protein with CBM2 domain